MGARLIVDEIGKDAKVAELEGIPGASATRERDKGFHNIVINHWMSFQSKVRNLTERKD